VTRPRLYVPDGFDRQPDDDYKRTRTGFRRDTPKGAEKLELVPFSTDDGGKSDE